MFLVFNKEAGNKTFTLPHVSQSFIPGHVHSCSSSLVYKNSPLELQHIKGRDLNFTATETSSTAVRNLLLPDANACVCLLSASSNGINIDLNADESDEFLVRWEDAAYLCLGFHHLVHFSSQHYW